MKKSLLLGVALAAIALSAPASAELKFKPGEDAKFNWANFEDLKKVDLKGETLSIFSDDMRVKRMLKAEEKAMALPAKLMVPLILFIFPCLMGVLMLPAGYRIATTLIGATG